MKRECCFSLLLQTSLEWEKVEIFYLPLKDFNKAFVTKRKESRHCVQNRIPSTSPSQAAFVSRSNFEIRGQGFSPYLLLALLQLGPASFCALSRENFVQSRS